jgi:hypothetical protein
VRCICHRLFACVRKGEGLWRPDKLMTSGQLN